MAHACCSKLCRFQIVPYVDSTDVYLEISYILLVCPERKDFTVHLYLIMYIYIYNNMYK